MMIKGISNICLFLLAFLHLATRFTLIVLGLVLDGQEKEILVRSWKCRSIGNVNINNYYIDITHQNNNQILRLIIKYNQIPRYTVKQILRCIIKY